MNQREQLNQRHYQQAVQFAEQFAKSEQQAFLQESEERYRFEQQRILQKISLKRPLAFWRWAAVCLAFVVSGFIYWQMGRYTNVVEGTQALHTFRQQQSEEDSSQRNQHYITHLQAQLRQNPNNGEQWFELAQAYALDNDFESALICYRNAQTVLGETAAILGGMATVEYYRNKQRFTPQIEQWINKALQLEPNESSSLLLLASNAFLSNDFQRAIAYWEQILAAENQSIDRREVIQSLNMAKQRLAAEQK